MQTLLSVNRDISSKYHILLFIALISAGLAGNYYNFEIFLNINFLFGSIFAMLALQFLGLSRGIIAAAIIASYTYFLWNHPYAIIVQGAEVAVVGALMGRLKKGMVLADALFWLFIGMPLVYLFYHLVMHVPLSNTLIVMIKQAVNGIGNVIIARLIFTVYVLNSRSTLISYSEIVYNLLAFFVLFPALLVLAVSSRTDFKEIDRHARSSLIQSSQRLHHYVESWVTSRKSSILNLAEMAASKSPHQLQPFLTLTYKSDANILRIGLVDKEATIIANNSPRDELKKSSIGKSFIERPFIPTLKRTLKPMFSEVVVGKIGIPKPIVLMLAPVVIGGEYAGYVAATLNLEQLREQLNKSTAENALFYTLQDKNGNVIMTNRSDQMMLQPFERGRGKFIRLDTGISQWLPDVPPNTPISERWKKSFYVAETSIGGLAEWKLILEIPIAPFQKALYDNYTGKLTLLFFLLFGALALAELLSQKIVTTLDQLRVLTHELPDRLVLDSECAEIDWPESGIKETNHLIYNFREMADSLRQQLMEIKRINASLEFRIFERTSQLDVTTTELLAEIEERKLVEVSLQKSESLYHSLVETSQDLIWQCDAKGRYTYLNLAWEQVFGYELNEMIGKEFSCFQTLEGAAAGLIAHDRLMKGNSVNSFEATHIGKTGNEIHLVFNALFITDEKGNIVGTSGTAYDITERKLMEEELRQAKTKAETASYAKSQFLATMSHEIRTPLSTILGNIDLLEGMQPSPCQLECLNDCKFASQMLLQIINDILDLAKIEAGKLVLLNEVFSVSLLSKQLVRMFSSAAKRGGLDLSLELASNLPEYIEADQQRLRQIIANLLSNAIKFTKHGGVTLKITREQTPSASHISQKGLLCIVVSNTGIGIPIDKLESIFDNFTQIEDFNTRTTTGTGLGLPICRQLLALMGGSIAASSVTGAGSAFTVMLPVAICPLPATSRVQANSHIQVPFRNILLADDDLFGRTVTQKLLQRRGYKVTAVENGAKLLESLLKEEFDIVLTDISMPEIDGMQVARIIRSGERDGINPLIPIIAMTAHAFAEDREHFLAAGINNYVSKPVNLEELFGQIEKLCGQGPTKEGKII